MVEDRYVPSRGDIVLLDFNPQAGHEPAGRRPSLVLSPYSYNDKTGLALLCPITNQVKGYPFEVAVQSPGTTSGVVLADQVKSLDWRARNARFADHATPQVIDEVLGKVKSLLA